MSRVIASRYVAITKGRVMHSKQRVRWVNDDTNKRTVFRLAKGYAVDHLRFGAIVELRAGSARGGVIERVKLVPHGPSAWRWQQAFET